MIRRDPNGKNFVVYGKLMAQEGKVQELTAYMQEVVKEMQNLDTCFCYILGEKADEPTASIFTKFGRASKLTMTV